MVRKSAADQPRSGTRATFIRTTDSAERDAEAARLYSQGLTYQQIADRLGWAHKTSVYRAIQRCFADIARGPAEELARSLLHQLEEMSMRAIEILDQEHVLVSHGRVVHGEDGQPLRDIGPKLAAIREVRQLNESIRRLTGTDAPAKTELQVTEVTQEDIALREFVNEIKAKNAATEEELRKQREAGG